MNIDIPMNRLRYVMAFFLSALACFGQNKSWTADNGNGTYTNPLFYDEFSDPDIIRVGDSFYLVGTTMHCNPGLVVLESKDLVNWDSAVMRSTALTSMTTVSGLKTARKHMARVSGLLVSVIMKASSTYFQTSTV